MYALPKYYVCSTAGDDYSNVLAKLTTVHFVFEITKRSVPDGLPDDQLCINVTILSDRIVEDDENFFLQLSTDDDQVRLYPEEAEVIIHDNDSECIIICI